MIYKTRTACGGTQDIGIYAIAAVVNDLAAEGVNISEGCSVRIQLLVPVDLPKSHIYAIIKIIKRTCCEYGLELLELHKERQAVLSECMVIVTGASEATGGTAGRKNFAAGQQIVMTKWAGMEGTVRIAAEKRAELGERFAPVFLKQIEEMKTDISALTEIYAAIETDAAKARSVSVIRQIGEGGIFAALWRLAEELGGGLDIELKRIAIRQETVEICEYFRLNPYQLASAGSMLMVTDDGEGLAGVFRRHQIEASVIGSLTDNHDKIIRNGKEVRYIDRPASDELNKIFMEDNHGKQ